jgi:divalent metal cation (Fe/Co/Zn/Cd) transporter
VTSYLHAVTAVTPMMLIFAAIAALTQLCAHLLFYSDTKIGYFARFCMGNLIILLAFIGWNAYEPFTNPVAALVVIMASSGVMVAAAYYMRDRDARTRKAALEAGKASALAETLTDANEE